MCAACARALTERRMRLDDLRTPSCSPLAPNKAWWRSRGPSVRFRCHWVKVKCRAWKAANKDRWERFQRST